MRFLPILLILVSACHAAAETLIYPGEDPKEVTIMLHGSKMTGESAANTSRFHVKTTGTVAYPTASDGMWGDDDIPAVLELAAFLRAEGAERVLVAGMSNGGSMAQKLACAAPGQIDAVASVAMFLRKPRPVCAFSTPFLLIAGTDDPLVRYDGSRWHFSAAGTMRIWSGCESPTNMQALPDKSRWDGSTAVLEDWCGSPHYRIDGGGHTWPGSLMRGANRDIDATKLIWEWFKGLKPVPTYCETCLLECAE